MIKSIHIQSFHSTYSKYDKKILRKHDMRAKVQNFTFFHTLRSQDNMIHAGFNMQVAKTPTYPVLCRLPLFVAL